MTQTSIIKGTPNAMDKFRFCDSDIQTLADIFSGGRARPDSMYRSREPAIGAGEKKMLDKLGRELEPPRFPIPWWASVVIDCRDHFKECALAPWVEDASENFPPEISIVALARQGSDSALTLLRGTMQPHALDMDTGGCTVAPGADSTLSVFYNTSDYTFVDSTQVPFVDGGGLVVLPWLVHCSLGVACMCMPILFEHFTIGLRCTRQCALAEPREAKPKLSAAVVARLRDEFPWLSEEDIQRAGRSHSSHSHAAGAHSLPDPIPAPPAREPEQLSPADAEDATVAAIQRELEELRLVYNFQEEAADNFYVHLPGGRWTATFRHMVSDQCIAKARAHVKRFCTIFRWPQSRGFSVVAYGQDEAYQLACELCRRGNFWYQRWLESDRAERFDNPAEFYYEEDPTFAQWADDLPPASKALRAVMEIRRMTPVRREL